MFLKNVCLFVFLFLSPLTVLASDFCDGFQRGFKVGYKRTSGVSLDPLPPLCPLQPLKGLSDPQSDYEHGYIIGMEEGMVRAAQESGRY